MDNIPRKLQSAHKEGTDHLLGTDVYPAEDAVFATLAGQDGGLGGTLNSRGAKDSIPQNPRQIQPQPLSSALSNSMFTTLERWLGYCTHNGDMRSDQSRINTERMEEEVVRGWKVSGATLFAIGAIDAEVLAFASTYKLTGTVLRCAGVSAISAVLGISTSLCLIASYTGRNGYRLKRLAPDSHSKDIMSVVFRLPLYCVLVSCTALSSLVIVLAYTTAPKLVISISAVAAILVGLQYIVIVALKLRNTIPAIIRSIHVAVRGAED
ncbi:hypothetical protein PENSPDRAFT_659126 [Peniophora sp. CONT]|nr:hypothetical protein PENSPDRAFT_659126 [Peniophora sp. CONT]